MNAECRNLAGGYECSCPAGAEGDPREACRTTDVCERAACGRGALCQPTRDAHRCVCPPGYTGDPHTECIGETLIYSPPRPDANPNYTVV